MLITTATGGIFVKLDYYEVVAILEAERKRVEDERDRFWRVYNYGTALNYAEALTSMNLVINQIHELEILED